MLIQTSHFQPHLLHNKAASGGFVQQEKWERWQSKRKLVSGSKHRDTLISIQGHHPQN